MNADGVYVEDVPLFAGTSHAPQRQRRRRERVVIEALDAQVACSPPGRWSTNTRIPGARKAPVIFRNTPQWFISMSKNDLRAKALTAIDEGSLGAEQGPQSDRSMIEHRPEWVHLAPARLGRADHGIRERERPENRCATKGQ